MAYSGLFTLTLEGDYFNLLERAFSVAEAGSSSGTLTHYRKTNDTIEFFSYELYGEKELKPLPVAYDFKSAYALVILWLQDKSTVYPEEPDTDGEAHKGYILTADEHRLSIKPTWIVYGK